VLHYNDGRNDNDMAGCVSSGDGHAAVVVCSIDSGALRCAEVPVTAIETSGHIPRCDGEDNDGDDEIDEDDESEDWIEDSAAGWEGSVAFEGSSLRITVSRGQAPPELAPFANGVPASTALADDHWHWPAPQ
jgi:hypothetical protein